MVGAWPLRFSALLGKKLANSAALCCSVFFVQVQLVGLISAQECPVGWHWNKVCFRGVLCHHIQKKIVKSAECRVQETIVWVQLQYHRRSMQLSAPWVYLLLAPDRLDAWPGDSHEPWRHGTPGKQGTKGS